MSAIASGGADGGLHRVDRSDAVLIALLFGIYNSELFPTEARLRTSGICNTFGRGATIVTSFLVVKRFINYGVVGVLAVMIGLLFALILTVAGLDIKFRQHSLKDLGRGAAEGGGSSAGDRTIRVRTWTWLDCRRQRPSG